MTKLSKFTFEKLTVPEMQGIKAGSGVSRCDTGASICTGSDHDSNNGDSC